MWRAVTTLWQATVKLQRAAETYDGCEAAVVDAATSQRRKLRGLFGPRVLQDHRPLRRLSVGINVEPGGQPDQLSHGSFLHLGPPA